MKASSLIEALKRKLGVTTQAELAAELGLSNNTLSNWNSRDKDLTADQIASALVKAREAAVTDTQFHTIKPIVEFFPIQATYTKRQAGYEIIGKSTSELNKGLFEALSKDSGIYIFYDSRGQALYAGKAKAQSLWKEMNSAFNRDRAVQTFKLVPHQTESETFSPAHETSRQHKPTQLKLHQLAGYFSAYKVDAGMIDDLEALLVRGFANDLLNIKMERFAHARYG